MPRGNVKSPLDRLLAARGSVSSGELADALGVSRQAAHAQLKRAVAAGILRAVGAGRAARYEPVVPTFTYAIAGSAEDRILADVEQRLPALRKLGDPTHRAFHYAFSEMVNNALDHSGGRRVEVRVAIEPKRVVFEVVDDGVGAFERVRSVRGLASHVEAAADVTKGKITTMPEQHSGEGIFFTSKVALRFELHANGHVLIVDQPRDDVAILAKPDASRGTRVHVEIARPPAERLVDVFAAHTKDHEFVRTRTVVRLFGLGTDFVSRSEARRLLSGLERFGEVLVDFRGVAGIGQGFADEIFRVWANAHPEVALLSVEMNDDVRFFVERAIRARERAR